MRTFILNKSSKNKKGITLTETLFSVLIISMVLVGVIFIFVQTLEISKRIDCEYTAAHLAKSRIERARNIIGASGFDSLQDLAETDTIIDADGVPDPDGAFKRSTVVTTNYGGDAKLSKVDVSILYKHKGDWKDEAAVTVTTVLVNVD